MGVVSEFLASLDTGVLLDDLTAPATLCSCPGALLQPQHYCWKLYRHQHRHVTSAGETQLESLVMAERGQNLLQMVP